MHFRRALVGWTIVMAALGPSVALLRAQDTTHALQVGIHGFIQVYYRSGDPLTKDGYRLRKADLKFSGPISPKLKWRVTFDAAKTIAVNKTRTEVGDSVDALSDASIDQKSRILQDAALTYTVDKNLQIDIGNQVIPLSLEGIYSTAQNETIERTMFASERSRAVGLGDIRDIGVAANGTTAAGIVEYHVGMFNEMGEGAGTIDVDDQKSIIGRVAIHPTILPGLQFGGSGGFEGGPATGRHERAAAEAQYRNTRYTVRAETMSARDGLLRRFGWYGLGAVRPTTRLQLVARYDNWDRDRGGETSIQNAFERQIVLGGSYLLEGTSRVAVNLVRQTFPNVSTIKAGTFVLVAFQAGW